MIKTTLMNYTILIISVLFFGSCNKINKNDLYDLFNSKSKIIFYEQNLEDEITIDNEDLIAINLENYETINLSNNITFEHRIKLSNSGRYIASYDDNFPHYGKFKIYDLLLNDEWVVEFKGIEGKMGSIVITDFDFFNDSTIIFSVFDDFYTYTIQEQDIKLYKNIENKYIYKFALNTAKTKIAIAYFNNYEIFDEQYLSIIDVISDTIIFVDSAFFNFCNWSMNNNEFIFSPEPNIFYSYNIDSSSIQRLDVKSNIEMKVSKVLYFSEAILLLSVSENGKKGSNLFLYDTIDKRIIKQLTFNHSQKFNIIVFNN